MSVKSNVAIAICKVSYYLMRMMGRTARALPGKLALMINPDLIRELGVGHQTIVITGTNGKTTTTHIIQQAILDTFGAAAYDPSSTNMEQGIATTLCLDSTLSGRRKSDWAVIESDEGATKTFLPAMHPQVLVVTNIYRDQINRYPTWTTARDYIIEATKSSPNTMLVLNADCQVTASIADAVPNPVLWFGVECDPYNEGIADYDSEVTCIKCNQPLRFSHRTFAHLGDFTCPACGYTHHRAAIAVTDVTARQDKSCRLSVRVFNTEFELSVNVRAGYDIYNAVAAFAGLHALGVSQEATVEALAHFTHAAHRFEIFDVDGIQVRLLLMKNTAGCNQLINMIVSEDVLPQNFICLLGNEIMDGASTEWVRKAHWEKLITPQTRFIVGGPCYEDMLDCLLCAGADKSCMRVQTNYAALVQDMTTFGESITVIANCSTIEALRLELVKSYKPIDFWTE